MDPFDDLFIANGGDMAIDAPGGTSPFFDLYGTGQQMFSIAIGGSNINAFYPGGAFLGNGSYELRSGAVQYVDGPRESQVPVGSVCVLGAYRYDDLNAEALSFATIPGGSYSMPLPC